MTEKINLRYNNDHILSGCDLLTLYQVTGKQSYTFAYLFTELYSLRSSPGEI